MMRSCKILTVNGDSLKKIAYNLVVSHGAASNETTSLARVIIVEGGYAPEPSALYLGVLTQCEVVRYRVLGG